MKWRDLLSLVGIIIFIYLILKIGISNIFNGISEFRLIYLIPILIFAIITLIMQVFKWNLILRLQNIRVNFIYLLKIYLIGNYYAAVTPSRVGSLIRAMYLKEKLNKNISIFIPSIVLERFLDLLCITILAIIGSLFLLKNIPNLFYGVIFLLFIILGLFLFFINKNRSRFVLKFFYKILIPNKFKKTITDSFNSFYDNLPFIKKLFIPFLASFLTWIFIFTNVYFIAEAVNFGVPLIYFITIYPIGTIVGLIPITMFGLGTREVSLIALFKPFNILVSKLISISVLSLLMFILTTAIPALIISFFMRKK